MKPGTVLFTKDGRKVGNAIVIDNNEMFDISFNKIMTDFGNIIRLTDSEIAQYFYIGERQSIYLWLVARSKK